MPIKDPDKRREYLKRYYAENRDKEIARTRRYREERPDESRATVRRYRDANIDKVRDREKQYRKANRSKRSARHYRDYPANRSKLCAAARLWAKENPTKAAAISARRRARKLGAIVGDPAAVAAREAEIRESRWCVWCQAEVDNLHIDHIWPLSKGGSHAVYNLQGLCAKHNLSKGSKLLPQLESGNGCRG